MDKRVHAYLARIGYSGPLDGSVEALGELQRRHLINVPYENLDILWGRRLSLCVDDLFVKVVEKGRGGYCFELNRLFGWLLNELGYECHDYFGRFVWREPEIPMRRHHVLLATCGGQRYLCDVGVGIKIPTTPLLLQEGLVQQGGNYRLTQDPFLGWVVHSLEKGEWEPLYAFTEEPQLPVDFVQPSFFCEYAPESIFNKEPMVAIRTEDGRKTLDGMTLKLFTKEGASVRELADEMEMQAALKEHFGIALP